MAFTTFSANTVIRSAEVNENFNLKADKASPTFTGTLTAAIVNATTVIGTTITATSLVATTLTATSVVGTTITATTLVSTSLTVSSAINLTGGQIAFPATAVPSSNANTFDDYEEGTFTPTISSTSGTITTASGTGIYVKFAKTVFYRVVLTITNAGTGSGLRFTLPFTASADQFGMFGRETASTGNSINGNTSISSNIAFAYAYNNTNLVVTGYVANVQGSFEV